MKAAVVLAFLLAAAPVLAGDDDVTLEQELEIGREVAARVLGSFPLDESNPELTVYLNQVCRLVAAGAERPEVPYRVGILATDDVNAFSAPGGFILLTRGLLEQIDSEAQLAAVLGHEIVHVDRRHVLSEIQRAEKVENGGKLVAGLLGRRSDGKMARWIDQVGEKAASKSMVFLFSRGLDKRDENESDLFGVELACRAGYSAAAEMISFLKNLDKLTKSPRMGMLVKTHPRPEVRIERLVEATCAGEVTLVERWQRAAGRID